LLGDDDSLFILLFEDEVEEEDEDEGVVFGLTGGLSPSLTVFIMFRWQPFLSFSMFCLRAFHPGSYSRAEGAVLAAEGQMLEGKLLERGEDDGVVATDGESDFFIAPGSSGRD